MDLSFLKWPAILCAVAAVAIAALILTGYVSWPLWVVLIPILGPFALGAVALFIFYAAWMASGSHAYAVLGIALTAALVFAAPAFAQDTTIDGASIFGAWKPYVVEIISIALAALATWVLATIKSKFGIDIEARHREALQSALTNAAGLVIFQVEKVAGSLKIDVGDERIANGVELVLKSVPDAVAYFGVTPATLREMLTAKIGVVAATSAPTA